MAISVVMTDAQRATLTHLCDTFVPSIEHAGEHADFWRRSASDLGVPDAIEQQLGQLPEDQLEGLRGLLDAFAAQGFDEAPPEAREQIVHAIADSSPEALAGVSTFRGLTTMLFYALPDPQTGRNPNWEAIGYPGPLSAPPDEPKPISPIRPEGDTLTLEADVVVVGSGCGGGVVAGTLAQAGRKVCVVEMGGYFNEADFNQLEMWAYQNLFLRGGPFPTADGQVVILAGSNLGGGSTVNWMNSLRTPDHVRELWEREHGLEGLAGPDYDRHLDAVMERINVTGDISDLNGPHLRLKEGCEKLGYHFQGILRNADPTKYDPRTAGFSGYGDQSGSKQGTLKTYLMDANERDADFVVDCTAERVLVENGRAAGVEGTYRDAEGREARVTVRAEQVVVAGGSLESPALLLRSGIGGPAAGDYLRLHPAGAVFAVYDEEQQAWWGPPQTGLSKQFADLEDGYGFLIECPSATTGITASSIPWQSGEQHKDLMTRLSRMASFINLTRDRGHGRVSINARGEAVHEYPFTDELDVRHFRRGLRELVHLHRAAGAREIYTLGRKTPPWKEGEDFDAWVEQVEQGALTPYDHVVFSAHQMGSCRLGADPATSVANPYGELHDVKGVWIGDASAFPTSTGSNPMITTMALAHRTAEAIAAAGS